VLERVGDLGGSAALFVLASKDTAWGVIIQILYSAFDRLCGLVARVPGYGSRGPGSIPGATAFSET
jgi:hypothetical protein